MKWLGLGVICAVVAIPVAGQGVPASKWELRRRLYPELTRTFDLAESAPAPLRAIALLRIEASPKLNDAEWKRELLEESLGAATQSPNLWPVDYAPMREDAPPSVMLGIAAKAVALNSGLDRLTLQTEAVRAMLAVDKTAVRDLFGRISPLELSLAKCSDALVPDVKAYYQTAGQVAGNSFTLAEGKERLDFVLGVVARISSAMEVGPAVQMLADLHLPQKEISPVVSLLAQKLERISGDGLSLFNRLNSTSQNLIKFCDSLSDSDALTLLKAWRVCLVRNLSGVRCAATVDPRWVYAKWATGAATAFNERVARLRSVVSIEPEDMRAEKVDPSLPDETVQTWAQQAEFQKSLDALIFGEQHTSLSNEQKNSAEWRIRFDQYLNAIDNQVVPDASDTDLIWKKCGLFGSAAMAAPPGDMRDRAIARYVALLKISNVPPEQLSGWYNRVHSLLDLLRSFNGNAQSVTKELENSGEPQLALVAEIYKLEKGEPAL